MKKKTVASKSIKKPVKAATAKKSVKSQPKKAVKAKAPVKKTVVKSKAPVKSKSVSKAKPAAKKTIAKKPVAKKPAAKKPAVQKSASIAKKATVQKLVKPLAKAVPAVKPMAKPVAMPVASVLPPVKTSPAPVVVAKPIPTGKPESFKVGHYVVYPTHGVGKILAEETQKVGDIELRLFVISFEKDKMTLRVPVHRATAAGLRNISAMAEIEKAFVTLRGRARTSRGMWSRRAQEYEAKINSGSIHSVAEVVRDLHRNVDQSERSYSERMIYESALARLVGELAAAQKLDSKGATEKLMSIMKTQAA